MDLDVFSADFDRVVIASLDLLVDPEFCYRNSELALNHSIRVTGPPVAMEENTAASGTHEDCVIVTYPIWQPRSHPPEHPGQGCGAGYLQPR